MLTSIDQEIQLMNQDYANTVLKLHCASSKPPTPTNKTVDARYDGMDTARSMFASRIYEAEQ
jgi:hypothetical protein